MESDALQLLERSRAFLEVFDPDAATAADGLRVRVAVKANIDVAGHVTSCGSRLLREQREPAGADADCLDGVRRSGAVVVGRTNMNQLAFGSLGDNADFGDVVNAVDDRLVPGGSSSGAAAAVANGWADVALGTDTAGSVRIPAACQGVAGLKPTFGLVPIRGVETLAPSLDTVGALARDVTGLETGLRLLVPGFEPDPGDGADNVGRLRIPGVHVSQDRAVDRALRLAGFDAVHGIDNSLTRDWLRTVERTGELFRIEMSESYADHVDDVGHSGFGTRVVDALRTGKVLGSDPRTRTEVYRYTARWADRFARLLDRHRVVALPTLPRPVPSWDEVRARHPLISLLVNPVNAAGLPAVTVPLRSEGRPVGLQLIGRADDEAFLLATARRIERTAHGSR